MSSPLTYSDQVPTAPGFYFRRDCQGVSVVKLPTFDRNGPELRAIWPPHWEAHREEKLALYPESSKAKARANVKGWLVEYAGPIPSPEEPETQEQREDRKIIERAQDLAEYLYGPKE